MLYAYRQRLRNALRARRGSPPLLAAKLIFPAVLTTVCYILFCLLVAPVDKNLDYHFLSERGLITAMSAILLAASAAFCLCAIATQPRVEQVYKNFLLLMVCGFIFLALDEVAQFHERLGKIVFGIWDITGFRNGNDLVVILYGVVAVPIFALLLPQILRIRMLIECFTVAFTFYLIHTFIDSTQDPRTTTSVIFEESSKLFCAVFLALGAYMVFADANEAVKAGRSD